MKTEFSDLFDHNQSDAIRSQTVVTPLLRAITVIEGTLIDVGEGLAWEVCIGVPVPLLFLFRSCCQRVVHGMLCPRA